MPFHAKSSVSLLGHLLAALSATVLLSSCATPTTIEIPDSSTPADLLIVDCLLPGQVRRLGSKITYLSPRRAIKTPASQCEIRGGEYEAYDRANAATSLRVWLPQAEQGDPEAQTHVGEIFEKGLGVEPDYLSAALWYRRAADQGYARARINLGYLHEVGLGVVQDLTAAMNLYREASGIDDGTLEYVSSVEFARRETARRETQTLRSRVEELSQALQASEERYQETQERARADRQALTVLKTQIEEKRREVQRLGERSGAGASESAQALAALESVRRELTQARQDNDALETRLQASRSDVQSLENTIELFESRGQATPAATSQALDEASQLEKSLSDSLAERTSSIYTLEQRQQAMNERYRQSIRTLQERLNLSESEQTRLAGRLADTELTLASSSEENQQLRERLLEQIREVENREAEQLRLSARVASLSMAASHSEEERLQAEQAADRSTAELVLARHEQTRLLTRLQETELRARASALDAEQELAILERKLDTQTGIVDSLQEQLSTLEGDLTRERARQPAPAVEQIAQLVPAGPSISIIEPPVMVTRGPIEIPRRSDGSLSLTGRVTPVDSLHDFSINGKRQPLNKAGIFDYAVNATEEELALVATDNTGETTAVQLRLASAFDTGRQASDTVRDSEATLAIDRSEFGNYHAIIIGNDEHQHLSPLNTAENDALAVDRILRERYGFSTTLLLNADKMTILQALSKAQAELSEQDNLILYYAGHGQLDAESQHGYWLPVDAHATDTRNWISNAVITSYLDSIPARQIMIVADSCYSGTLTQASIPRSQEAIPAALHERWLKLMARRKVRTILSSGGIRPVYDGISSHSLFAGAFIRELQANDAVLEGYRLFSAVQKAVRQSAATLGVEQTPQYSAVRHAGHEVGEFLLVAK